MAQIIVISILFLAAAVGAFLFALSAVGALQIARQRREGVLQYFVYAIFLSGAATILASGRNFNADDFAAEASGGFVASWIVRIVSVFTMVACADQVIRYFARSPKIEALRAVLLFTFVMYWITNLVIPAFFATHPTPYAMPWTYSLFLGVGVLCLYGRPAMNAVLVARNAIVLICAASLLLIPIIPGKVLDLTYAQGYLPGIPRLAGLAPHAIMLGSLAAMGVLCLMTWPFERTWANRSAWTVVVLVLILAQAKSAWISSAFSIPLLLAYQQREKKFGPKGLMAAKAVYVLPVMALILGLVLFAVYLTMAGGIDRIDHYLSTKAGAQILTLTGRDRIWNVAIEEWKKAPIFGYGYSLFSVDFRNLINMPFATHAHSQYLDSLARTGALGATFMCLHFLALVWAGFRLARATRGLSAVLVIGIVVAGITDLTVSLNGINIVNSAVYILWAVVAAGLYKESSPKTEPAVAEAAANRGGRQGGLQMAGR